MNDTLARCLEDMENRIDDSVEAELDRSWRDFCHDRIGRGVFDPCRPTKRAPQTEWPSARINRAIEDHDAMLLHQFAACSRVLASGSGELLTVRANYGTPILAMVFGGELFMMPDDTDTLPACRPFDDAPAALRRIAEADEPTLENPYLQRVFDTTRQIAEIQSTYPRIGRWVRAYHPDLQGPIDVLDLLLGAATFELLYDEPGLVHAALDRITTTYARVMKAWQTLSGVAASDVAHHWAMLHRGTLMIRNDSAMNISGDMFDEFIRPYDQRLLDEFGGGAIHACGRVDHFINRLSTMRGYFAMNLTQPHLNDMDKCFAATIDQGMQLIGLPRAAAEQAGRDLLGRVHVL